MLTKDEMRKISGGYGNCMDDCETQSNWYCCNSFGSEMSIGLTDCCSAAAYCYFYDGYRITNSENGCM